PPPAGRPTRPPQPDAPPRAPARGGRRRRRRCRRTPRTPPRRLARARYAALPPVCVIAAALYLVTHKQTDVATAGAGRATTPRPRALSRPRRPPPASR